MLRNYSIVFYFSQFRGVLGVIEDQLHIDQRFKKQLYRLLILFIHFLYMKVSFFLLHLLFFFSRAFVIVSYVYTYTYIVAFRCELGCVVVCF